MTKDLYYERVLDLIEGLSALVWLTRPEDPNANEHITAKNLENEWRSLKGPLLEAFSVREGIQLILQFIEKGEENEED